VLRKALLDVSQSVSSRFGPHVADHRFSVPLNNSGAANTEAGISSGFGIQLLSKYWYRLSLVATSAE
jgi:hypothetical protein